MLTKNEQKQCNFEQSFREFYRLKTSLGHKLLMTTIVSIKAPSNFCMKWLTVTLKRSNFVYYFKMQINA